MSWYYLRSGKQYGPISFSDLEQLVRANLILATDLVWSDGMIEWVAANTIADLFPPMTQPPRVPAASLPSTNPLPSFIQIKTHPKRMPKSTPADLGANVFAGIIVLGMFALCCGGPLLAIRSIPERPRDPKAELRTEAWIYAEHFVKNHLKAPATADFPNSSSAYTISDLGDGRWRVSGYVDAENSFGALLRNRWTVTMLHSDGKWLLLDCNIHE